MLLVANDCHSPLRHEVSASSKGGFNIFKDPFANMSNNTENMLHGCKRQKLRMIAVTVIVGIFTTCNLSL